MNTNIKLLETTTTFHENFKGLSEKFELLELYVAWVGNPFHLVPFETISSFKKISAFIGIAFCQSNPDGIQFLIDSGHNVNIVLSKETYHPKLYFFSNGSGDYALLMGSSNFTHSAFAKNIEANILIHGPENQEIILNFLNGMRKQVKALSVIEPTPKWLSNYRIRYNERQKKLRKDKVIDDSLQEDESAPDGSWLNAGTWNEYLSNVNHASKLSKLRYARPMEDRFAVFDEYAQTISLPWEVSLFATIENRRRLLGIEPYAWLGHIGASGDFQRMLANGTLKEKRAICKAMNNIDELKIPDDYDGLTMELNKLVALGPSIKVWGRLLAITQPDKYCTISAKWLRKGFSKLLNKPESYFETVEGYIELLKIIHLSPWYNRKRPRDTYERKIWELRVAMIDVVIAYG